MSKSPTILALTNVSEDSTSKEQQDSTSNWADEREHSPGLSQVSESVRNRTSRLWDVIISLRVNDITYGHGSKVQRQPD